MIEAAAIAAPARRIVDLAQSGLTIDELVAGVLEVLDTHLGVDNAFAVRDEDVGTLVAYNADRRLQELATRSFALRTTRYAGELSPVFRTAVDRGACLDSEFYPSDRAKRSSTFHREIVAAAGVRSMMHVCASWRGRPLLRLNLNRHGAQPFRRAELEWILCLLPTLEASLVACMADDPSSRPLASLSPREREIAELVARGLTNRQIATLLGTSVFTVRNQLSRVFEKVEVESRTELAVLVAEALGRRPS